jgi:hypothetical protein
MRLLIALVAVCALFFGCEATQSPETQPSEAEVKAKFFDLVLSNEILKTSIDITSVRTLSEPQRIPNDFIDGHFGVGYKWCLILSPKQRAKSEQVAEGLLFLNRKRSSLNESQIAKASEIVSSWKNSGAFLISATYKVGSNWNKDDPWYFSWNWSENVC